MLLGPPPRVFTVPAPVLTEARCIPGCHPSWCSKLEERCTVSANMDRGGLAETISMCMCASLRLLLLHADTSDEDSSLSKKHATKGRAATRQRQHVITSEDESESE